MSYTPTQGIFVNGQVIDGPDLLNEFGAISGAIAVIIADVQEKATETLQDSKEYTDNQLASVDIDGGTF